MKVLLAPEGQAELDRLPVRIRVRVLRVLRVFERLTEWPFVSETKGLRRERAQHYRIRTGDWRIIFQAVQADVIVVHIKPRSEAYAIETSTEPWAS